MVVCPLLLIIMTSYYDDLNGNLFRVYYDFRGEPD